MKTVSGWSTNVAHSRHVTMIGIFWKWIGVSLALAALSRGGLASATESDDEKAEARAAASEQKDLSRFPAGILLIGAAKIAGAEKGSTIDVITPSGEPVRTLFQAPELIVSSRLSRPGDQIAFVSGSNDGKSALWILRADNEATKIADDVGFISAWSPNGRQLAYYRVDKGKPLQSFVMDVESKERVELKLAADCVAEDWHPREDTRTLIYMNPRNRLYREKRGDSYPTRQLDLLTSDGKQTPITRNPSSDNIWSRFSPSGDRLAYYQRRVVDEASSEYAVVSSADGSEPKEIFGFTDAGKADGLPWFRPNGPPAWSPDGKTLAWLVTANTQTGDAGGKLELVLVGTDGTNVKRISLTDLGFRSVRTVEWN